MKYWFEYTKKYQIPKPVSWEGWLVTIIYAILVLIVTFVAVYLLENEGIVHYIITLAVGIIILSITYSAIRERKIDPSTKMKEKQAPKIKGGKKKKGF
ncbi:MAG: hypothetical protein GX362_01780 [Methanosarcinaceae archaeon]|nr:hypothetical protein [Methanosarcinaceae archaeon]